MCNMPFIKQDYNWYNIDLIPRLPGVYSWYYTPELTEQDIEIFINTVTGYKNENENSICKKYIEEFIVNRMYSFFKEEEYGVSLEGKLKPTYTGFVKNDLKVSDNLIDRLLKDPQKIYQIKTTLDSCVPESSSPIYIGMAENLYDRVNTHRRLITKFRKKYKDNQEITDHTKDESFAKRIAERNFLPTNLKIFIFQIEEQNNIIEVEHILNKINYPLLGRN